MSIIQGWAARAGSHTHSSYGRVKRAELQKQLKKISPVSEKSERIQ